MYTPGTEYLFLPWYPMTGEFACWGAAVHFLHMISPLLMQYVVLLSFMWYVTMGDDTHNDGCVLITGECK